MTLFSAKAIKQTQDRSAKIHCMKARKAKRSNTRDTLRSGDNETDGYSTATATDKSTKHEYINSAMVDIH